LRIQHQLHRVMAVKGRQAGGKEYGRRTVPHIKGGGVRAFTVFHFFSLFKS
jgi:hypothetical protein